MLLRHAGVPFEDVRIKFEDWPKQKETFELQQLPVLDINGTRLNQSYAIILHLGRLYGYMCTCPEATSQILCEMNTFEDFFNKSMLAFFQFSPYDEAQKTAMQEDFIKTDFPFIMAHFEEKLKTNKSQEFIFGTQYTVADFYILGFYKHMKMTEKLAKAFDTSTQYPLMKAYFEKRFADLEGKAKVTTPVKPKFYYFDMDGRGSMIRLLLKQAKVPFEDVRIKFADWPKMKDTFPLKQLPVLEIDGRQLVQSDAIMQFLSLRYEYLPLKAEKYYDVLFLADTIKDIYEGFAKFFYSSLPPEKKNELAKEYYEKTAPTLMAAIEKRLKANKSQEFLVGRKYTMADFYMLGTAQWLVYKEKGEINELTEGKLENLLKSFPTLKGYIDKRLTDFK